MGEPELSQQANLSSLGSGRARGEREEQKVSEMMMKSRSLSSRESRCFVTVLTVCEESSLLSPECTSFVPNEPSWLLPLHAYALVDEGFQFHWAKTTSGRVTAAQKLRVKI